MQKINLLKHEEWAIGAEQIHVRNGGSTLREQPIFRLCVRVGELEMKKS